MRVSKPVMKPGANKRSEIHNTHQLKSSDTYVHIRNGTKTNTHTPSASGTYGRLADETRVDFETFKIPID